MPYSSATGVEIYYELRGEGPTLLIVRGLGRSMEFWLELGPMLESDFTVLYVDNRGVGRSTRPRLPFTTRDMADDCAGVIRGLGLGPIHVFGISLGGMVVQELALNHPDLVKRLILGATTPGLPHAVKPRWRDAAGLAAAPLLPIGLANRRSAPLILSDEFLARRPEIIDIWEELLRAQGTDRRSFLLQLGAASRHSTGRRLRRLAAPTLVLTGTADRLIPAQNSAVLDSLIPDSRLRWLPGVGHDFPTEVPAETAAIFREFFLELPEGEA